MANPQRVSLSVVDGGLPERIQDTYRTKRVEFGGGSGNDGGGGGSTVDSETQRHLDTGMRTVKAENDARFAEVMAGIDKVNNNLSAFGDTVRVRLDTLDERSKDAKQAAERAEDATRTVKWNVLFTGLTVAALAYGSFALWNQAIEMTTGIIGSERQVD